MRSIIEITLLVIFVWVFFSFPYITKNGLKPSLERLWYGTNQPVVVVVTNETPNR